VVKVVRRSWLLDEGDCDVGKVNFEKDREDGNVNKKAAMYVKMTAM
jgi:hypothetical protein